MNTDIPNSNPQTPGNKTIEPTNSPIENKPLENQVPNQNPPIVFNQFSKKNSEKKTNDREHVPFGILILKLISLLLLFTSSFTFVWFSLDLSKSNTILSSFGRPENTEIKFNRLEKQKKFLENENQKLESQIRQFETRIQNKAYFVYTKTINELKGQQYQWFDGFDDDGKEKYGILNGVENIKDYFNSRNYKNSILMAGNNIEIQNINASREKINFTVTGTSLFGKVFFLNSEFLQILNSFPLYKNGEIRNFIRKKMDNGNDGMTFSLTLDIQKKDEEDPDDSRFSEYENWKNTSITSKDISNIQN